MRGVVSCLACVPTSRTGAVAQVFMTWYDNIIEIPPVDPDPAAAGGGVAAWAVKNGARVITALACQPAAMLRIPSRRVNSDRTSGLFQPAMASAWHLKGCLKS